MHFDRKLPIVVEEHFIRFLASVARFMNFHGQLQLPRLELVGNEGEGTRNWAGSEFPLFLESETKRESNPEEAHLIREDAELKVV